MDNELPRGIRLNNPGNIDRTEIAWLGESTMQDDPRFIRFNEPVFGLRALMKILYNYQEKDDIEHLRGMINRWAPPNENQTNAYLNDVCARCSASPDESYDVSNKYNLMNLAKAIVHHENGAPPAGRAPDWYPQDIYNQAAAMVLLP